MFDAVEFSGDKYKEEVWIPKTSDTQEGVYRHLKQLCFGEERFDGPLPEVSVSRCSLDIGFISLNGKVKIAYEIDGPDHVEEYDRRRDYYLKVQRGWTVYRIRVDAVDAYGFDTIARMICCHLLYQLGFIKEKHWLPGVIETYNAIH